jgi:hypothetical protein
MFIRDANEVVWMFWNRLSIFAFALLLITVVFAGCSGSSSGDGNSDWGFEDASDTVSDTSADATDTTDGGDAESGLLACCERFNVPEPRCRNSLGRRARCSSNTGCTDLPDVSGCGCRCTACHDETCLRVHCVDGPNCGGRDAGM